MSLSGVFYIDRHYLRGVRGANESRARTSCVSVMEGDVVIGIPFVVVVGMRVSSPRRRILFCRGKPQLMSPTWSNIGPWLAVSISVVISGLGRVGEGIPITACLCLHRLEFTEASFGSVGFLAGLSIRVAFFQVLGAVPLLQVLVRLSPLYPADGCRFLVLACHA